MRTILLGCVINFVLSVASATPAIINYQAKLTGLGGAPITSPVNLTFTFWDAANSGNQLGSGFSDLDAVTPSGGGVVSTAVGDAPGVGIPSSVFASDTVWLNVNVNGANLMPRQRIVSAGHAVNALPLYGQACVITEATSNPSLSGMNLLATVARANALTPHGQPLSATNRAVVVVTPGRYDLGTTQVMLDTDFVDMIGLSSAREHQYIFGTSNGAGTGVLRQTANDVHIENLLVECKLTSGGFTNTASDPSAYFPDSGSTATVVRNCEFRADALNAWSMRVLTGYAGNYADSVAGYNAFGGLYGTASGTFTNCTGGNFAFGGDHGVASGTFTNCMGGAAAFGGFIGTASGKFTNCAGGFAAFGGYDGTASGTLTRCTGGDYAFGGSGTASGTFTNCTGGDNAFGGEYGTAGGKFTNCTGGPYAFAGANGTAAGGKFFHCNGGDGSFTTNGSPTVLYCVQAGVPYP